MNHLIGAEALRLRTARTSAGLALAAVVMAALIAAAAALTVAADDLDPGRVAFAGPGVAQAFALILGVLAVTTEFRHGTITPTLLVSPRRGRVLGAKLAVHAAAGLALGLVAFGLGAAIVLLLLASRGVASGLDGVDVLRIVVGGTLGGALFAALGVGIGTLVHNQVGAIIGALVWLYVIEQTLVFVPGVGEAVRRLGIAGLSSGLSASASPDPDAALLGQVPAGLVLATYAVLVLGAGAVLLSRRDVTR